jgi:2-polyprenyl-3-methyl-5-hydroxy-6-metoxy-1,4-benzoquinol methylase
VKNAEPFKSQPFQMTSKYYPSNYYSYQSKPVISMPLKRFLKKERAKFVLTGNGLIGRLMHRITGESDMLKWIKNAALNTDSKILDVGCGAGIFLLELQELGLHICKALTHFYPTTFFMITG